MSTYSYPSDFKGTLWRMFDGDVYVSYDGNDGNNGHPQKPVATLQHALSIAQQGQKIIVGTGLYNENVDGLGKGCTLISDGTVEMYGTNTGGAAFTNMGAAGVVAGFKIIDYSSCTNDDLFAFEDCFIMSADVMGAVNTMLRCVVKNCDVLDNVSNFSSCTFINAGKPGVTGGSTVESCHFDSASSFVFSSSTMQVFDYCNQETGSTIKIDGTVYNNAAAVFAAFPQYQEHGSSVLPAFNSPGINNYTLRLSSPLVESGANAQPTGALPQALSFDSKALAKSNIKGIIFDNNGYMTLPDEATEGFMETFVIDLLETRVVGRIDLFAEQHFSHDYFSSVTINQNTFSPPRPITFQMRYGNNDKELQRLPYKDFIWDKMPTVDSKGQGNGSPEFNPLTEQPVYTRYVQFRIILRHTSESFFINQENGDLLLQEDGSKLKTENA